MEAQQVAASLDNLLKTLDTKASQPAPPQGPEVFLFISYGP